MFLKKQPAADLPQNPYTLDEHNPSCNVTMTCSSSPFTRPSSGFSNIDTPDDTRNPTPFELTPETSPVKPAAVPLLTDELPTSHNEMPTEQVELFHGDKEGENPNCF